MIKANELTVGRCFIFTNENSVARAIDKEDMADIDELLCVIEPIHLTPEVLEKCGFETANTKRDFGNGFEWCRWELKYQYIFQVDKGIFEYSLFQDEFGSNEKGVEITSLHQLQNLYFALTGEELNIQL